MTVHYGVTQIMNDMNPSTKEISVLLADDHTLILDIVGMVLDATPDISLKTATSVDGAMQRLKENGTFDLILLDLDMPGMNGGESLRRVMEANAGKPVGIFTGGPTPGVIDEMTKNGAAGVIPKTTSMKSLTNAIRFMAAGERYFPIELLQTQEAALAGVEHPLSEREFSVLQKLSAGLPNREIGEALGLAEATVKMHVKSVCKKLGVGNRTQAVIAARRLKLV